MKVSNIIRWLLTIFLLVGVWFNSHWTVALSLTLTTISLELTAYSFKQIIEILKLND